MILTWSLKKFQNLAFIYGFLADFVFFFSFYNKIYIDYNISNIQLSYLIIIVQFSKLIADVPIGLIADKIGQKWLFLIATMSRIILCFVLLYGYDFKTFVIGSIVFGINMSSVYSHTEAYFYSALKCLNKENYLPRFLGKFYSIQNIAISIATFISGVIYNQYGIKYVLWLSIATLSMAGILSIFFLDEKQYRVFNKNNNFNVLKIFINMISKPKLIRLAILSSLLDGMFITFIELNTIILVKMDLKILFVTNIIGIIGIIRIFSNYFSGYTAKHMSFKRMNSYLLIFVIISMIACFKNKIFISASMILFLSIYPLFDTSVKTKIQKNIGNINRATISSFCTMLTSFIVIGINILIGNISEKLNYRTAFFALLILVMIITSILRNILNFYKIKRIF